MNAVVRSLLLTPTVVDVLAPERHGASKVTQIVGGSDHTLFLFDNGQVWGCSLVDPDSSCIGLGDDHPRMVEALTQIKELTARREAVQAESGFDAAMAEVPSTRSFVAEPACLKFLVSVSGLGQGRQPKIVRLAFTGRANLAVDDQGDLYAWGEGNSCQLGLGTSTEGKEIKTPTRVANASLERVKVIGVRLGAQHALISCVSSVFSLAFCTHSKLASPCR